MQDNYSYTEVNDILAKINWSQWMYKAALSPEPLNFTTIEAGDATQLANGFIALNGTGAPENYVEYSSWYTNLKVIF